jgi:hypothetical protein
MDRRRYSGVKGHSYTMPNSGSLELLTALAANAAVFTLLAVAALRWDKPRRRLERRRG